ncbi:DUF4405 domain-containing protein [candidate division KSB1 bacterium]|nr:DUF4405 domain-containing protein [candidate division KSB1 bacterium]
MKKIKTNKTKINFIIDVLLLLIMSAIAGIGFLIKYVLLTGEQKWIKFGANIDQTLFGLDRHGWGYIHLVLGFICIGLLILHIIFHWKMIVCMFGHLLKPSTWRNAVSTIFLLICLVLIFIPLFLTPKNIGIESGHGHFHRSLQNTAPDENIGFPHGQRRGNQERINSVQSTITEKAIRNEHSDNETTDTPIESGQQEHYKLGNKTLNIRGYMTLKEISNTYNVPVSNLKKELGIGDNESENTRLGVLRKQYNFQMSQIEKIITDYQNSR